MQAVRLHRTAADGTQYSVSNPAPPAALVFEHKVPLPQLTAPGQVLVRVHASTVTRDELTWPESYATDFPILGHDLAGVVVATYDGTSGFKPGDEVYGMVSQEVGCSWAQYVVAEGRELAPKPKGLSWTESAAVAMNGLTAWQALFEKAKFQEPDFSAVDNNGVMQQRTLLVTGAAGMVGTWIVQLASLAGIPVTAATSSNARNAAFLRSLGAYKTIEYAELSASSTKYDAIIDTAGGEPQAHCWDAVADDGILISVDSGSFGIAENKPPGKEHVEALFFIVQVSGAQMARLTPALEAGLVETFVSEVYPLAEARTAYERASSRLEKRGKVVLSIEG